jgi:hypothetical protein
MDELCIKLVFITKIINMHGQKNIKFVRELSIATEMLTCRICDAMSDNFKFCTDGTKFELTVVLITYNCAVSLAYRGADILVRIH